MERGNFSWQVQQNCIPLQRGNAGKTIKVSGAAAAANAATLAPERPATSLGDGLSGQGSSGGAGTRVLVIGVALCL